MKDTQFFAALLDLQSPWQVAAVVLQAATNEVEVRVVYRAGEAECPECAQTIRVAGHLHRRWRHLDSCQYRTIIVADVPYAECPLHGMQRVPVPWAAPDSRVTTWFERRAIERLFGIVD